MIENSIQNTFKLTANHLVGSYFGITIIIISYEIISFTHYYYQKSMKCSKV
jgi:hypothetical protein